MHGQLSLAFMGAPLTIEFASLGMADSLILMVMALVVFGPRRLPQIGRQIGKLMYEFRKASNDFKFQMEEELRNAEEADRRKKEEERQKALAAQRPTEQAPVSVPPAPVNAIESPYPGEGTYPPQALLETPAALPATDESTPRIMPPATGETIPAERPARGVGQSEDAASNTTEPGTPPDNEGAAAPAEFAQPVTEQPKDATAEARTSMVDAVEAIGKARAGGNRTRGAPGHEPDGASG